MKGVVVKDYSFTQLQEYKAALKMVLKLMDEFPDYTLEQFRAIVEDIIEREENAA